MRRLVAVAVAVVVLGGCGGAGPPAPTVKALADRLAASEVGCYGFGLRTDQRELGAREQAHCDDNNGERLDLLTYNTNSARDTSNGIAREFGGIAAVGDRWVVRTDTEAAAVRVAKVLGGKVI